MKSTLTVRHRAAYVAMLVAVFLGSAGLRAQAPPLGEVAKKEQERRKAQDQSRKVYTAKDLKPVPARPEAAAPAGPVESPGGTVPAAQATPPAVKASEPAAAPDAARDEASWRKRITDAREELRRAEMFAEALQSRINSLTRDVQSRDDYAQRARLGGERKEALAELARVRQDIERGKKQIADIEEEARKAGVPPGWLR